MWRYTDDREAVQGVYAIERCTCKGDTLGVHSYLIINIFTTKAQGEGLRSELEQV